MRKRTVDPMDSANHGIPLWVVYGMNCFPQIVCVKLLAYDSAHVLLPVGDASSNVCIWGYSVYKRRPGFRTLGTNVKEWVARSTFARFYVSQDEALDDLRRLTTPKGA